MQIPESKQTERGEDIVDTDQAYERMSDYIKQTTTPGAGLDQAYAKEWQTVDYYCGGMSKKQASFVTAKGESRRTKQVCY